MAQVVRSTAQIPPLGSQAAAEMNGIDSNAGDFLRQEMRNCCVGPNLGRDVLLSLRHQTNLIASHQLFILHAIITRAQNCCVQRQNCCLQHRQELEWNRSHVATFARSSGLRLPCAVTE